jgi:hypothetical protein
MEMEFQRCAQLSRPESEWVKDLLCGRSPILAHPWFNPNSAVEHAEGASGAAGARRSRRFRLERKSGRENFLKHAR